MRETGFTGSSSGPREFTVTTPIVLFFLFGAAFGLATGSNQHLFSEGRARPAEAGTPVSLGSRVLWVLICSCLWPILLLTGAVSLLQLARVRVRAARDRQR